MSPNEEKANIVKVLLERTIQKEEELRAYSKSAQERANEAEGAMKSRYDTFKEEGQYLASGLIAKHEDAKRSLSVIKSILDLSEFGESIVVELCSIVTVELEDGDQKEFFLFPILGGEKIGETTVISPSSPIGKALIGKIKGDGFSFIVGKKLTEGEVTNVR